MKYLFHKLTQFPGKFKMNRYASNKYQTVCFVPKKSELDIEPWTTFGSTREEYEKWVPEICGICCLKMVGDTLGKTNDISLYQLTLAVLEKGGFKFLPNGSIQGVFHKPLLKTAMSFGIQGVVVASVVSAEIIRYVQDGKFVLLSVDLSKTSSGAKGGHLVLVHQYIREADEFVIHDSANVLGKSGNGLRIARSVVDYISNEKGVIMWGE